jgi:hypothetical protein
MTVSFKVKHGHRVSSVTDSMGLMNWYAHTSAECFYKNNESIAKSVMPGPYHEKFILTVVAAVEHKFGKSIDVDEDFLDKEWYQSGLPDDYFNPEVIVKKKYSNPKICFYEE